VRAPHVPLSTEVVESVVDREMWVSIAVGSAVNVVAALVMYHPPVALMVQCGILFGSITTRNGVRRRIDLARWNSIRGRR